MDLDKQYEYMVKYKIDPIETGELCDQYPGLKNAWEQFKTTLNLCKVTYEADRQIS